MIQSELSSGPDPNGVTWHPVINHYGKHDRSRTKVTKYFVTVDTFYSLSNTLL